MGFMGKWLFVALFLFDSVLGASVGALVPVNYPITRTDGSVTVEWTSEVGSVYQIEFWDYQTLVNGGASWGVLASNVFSQGTKTTYVDVGNVTASPLQYHPRVSTGRALRVRKIGQAAATTIVPNPTVAVKIYNSNNVELTGTPTVRGDMVVTFNVTALDIVDTVQVLVDGEIHYETNKSSGLVWINTTEWANGSHKINVVARVIDGAEVTVDGTEQSTVSPQFGFGTSATRTVNFDNFVHKYFVSTPFYLPDPNDPWVVQEIAADFKANASWRIFVVDGFDQVVSAYEGTGTSAWVGWDGRDFDGHILPNGFYDYVVQAVPFGQSFPNGSTLSTTPRRASPAGDGLENRPDLPEQAREARSKKIRNLHRDARLRAANGKGWQARAQMARSSLGRWRSAQQQPTWNPNYLNTRNPVMFNPPPTPQPEGDVDINPPPLPPLPRTREVGPANSNPDPGQETRTPYRVPATFFMGWMSTFVTGLQAHHPSRTLSNTWASPQGGLDGNPGPWGPLRLAHSLVDNFTNSMVLGGWKAAFTAKDNYLSTTYMTGCYNANKSIHGITNTSNCEFLGQMGRHPGMFAALGQLGFLVGHSSVRSASAANSLAKHSFYPIYDSRKAAAGQIAHKWIGFPDIDMGMLSFGELGFLSPLRWFAMYSCRSLRSTDVTDMVWRASPVFLMPPNLNAVLGAETRISIIASFGKFFADNLIGSNATGTPLPVVDAWFDASRQAHAQAGRARNPFKRPAARTMTALIKGGTRSETIYDLVSGSQDMLDYQTVSEAVYTP